MLLRASLFCRQFNTAVKQSFIHKTNALLKKSVSREVRKSSETSKNIICGYSRLCTGVPLSVACLRYAFIKKATCEPKKANVLLQRTHFDWKKLLYLIYLDIWRWLGAVIAALFVAYVNVKIPLCLGELANIIASLSAMTSAVCEMSFPLGKIIIYHVAQALGTLIYIGLLSSAGEILASRLKFEAYQSIIKQDIEFFDSKRTGELLDCLFADVQEFKSSFKQCVSQGLKNIVQICGSVVSLFSISPSMTYTVLTVVPVVIAIGSLVGTILRTVSRAAQEQSTKLLTISEEVLSNIRTVRSFSNESLECDKFHEELNKASELNIKLGYGIAFFQAGTNLFLNSLVLGTMYVGSRYVVSDNLPPGHLMSFLVTSQMIQKSLGQLSLTFGHFLKGKESFKRICYYSELKPRIPISGGIRIPFHSLVPTLEFKNVSFAYPSRISQTILQDFNLILPAGKTVAIVGGSGNGKSTIALLLERFYDVEHGSITLNGVDIRKLDPQWLRGSVIGIINQEPVLFATSVKENIRYGKPDATDEEVYLAAQQANAEKFIKSFPDGYETVLGERGVTISGGQKQRIAIARALIKNPSILILDEATSALDSESEKIVQETLEKVCQGKTVLVVAHRLSTVRNADVIAVLNKGVIVEMGTHDYLMKKQGAYYKMVMQQQNDDRHSG